MQSLPKFAEVSILRVAQDIAIGTLREIQAHQELLLLQIRQALRQPQRHQMCLSSRPKSFDCRDSQMLY